MILGRTVLGQLVRETALTAVRSQVFVHDTDNNYMPPALRRQLALDDIGKRFAAIDCTSAQFLATMFSTAKELRARGIINAGAGATNTARARGNTGNMNAPGNTGTGGGGPSPLLTGGMSSPHSAPLVSPNSTKVAPSASFMGTARGGGKDATTVPDESPRSTPPARVAAAPVTAPVNVGSAWRGTDVWKGESTVSGSPSAGSLLVARGEYGSGRQAGGVPQGLLDPGSPSSDNRRQSRVLHAKDVALAMEYEATSGARSGSFSSATPTVVPLSAAPKLEVGRRPTGGFIGKEPVNNKPPSPAGSGVQLTSPHATPQPLGSASNWKPAVTKNPVAKP